MTANRENVVRRANVVLDWDMPLDDGTARDIIGDLLNEIPPVYHGDDETEKFRIYINRNLDMTPNKRAAHAVHAALEALGVHPGTKVIVLDKGPTAISDMRTVIFDAGHTEILAGSMTAGTDWPEDSQP